jgi:hypothetical protein
MESPRKRGRQSGGAGGGRAVCRSAERARLERPGWLSRSCSAAGSARAALPLGVPHAAPVSPGTPARRGGRVRWHGSPRWSGAVSPNGRRFGRIVVNLTRGPVWPWSAGWRSGRYPQRLGITPGHHSAGYGRPIGSSRRRELVICAGLPLEVVAGRGGRESRVAGRVRAVRATPPAAPAAGEATPGPRRPGCGLVAHAVASSPFLALRSALRRSLSRSSQS